MTKHLHVTRRTVLRGIGTAVALPLLDAMLPTLAAAKEPKKVPTRMAFVYVPNGKHMPDWTPAATGAEWELPYIMQPLAPVKEKLLVLSGLAQHHARANGDGPGDHARALAAFLTGTQPRKTHGADIRAGVSVDQVAARRVGQRTKFSSLELGCDLGAQAGNCDSGYSCSYSTNMSWRTDTTPQAKEINPKLAFERLFAFGEGSFDSTRDMYRKSVLDMVLEDARTLQSKLGAGDKRKVDEYLTSVRELEQRIGLADKGEPVEPPTDFPKIEGVPKDYAEHIRVMFDILALAFQTDLTRVATFVMANEGSNRSYAFIDVPEGHHDLSHHGGDAEKQRKIREINLFHVTQLGYFLEKMQAIQEGERSLLDNSMVLYGSGIGDGNRHNHDDLPILLAGCGGDTVKPDRHVKFRRETPLNNLYLSMLDRMESSIDELGDSTGRLAELA